MDRKSKTISLKGKSINRYVDCMEKAQATINMWYAKPRGMDFQSL